MDVKLGFDILMAEIKRNVPVYSAMILDHQMNLLLGDFKINFFFLSGSLDKSVTVVKYLNIFSRT